MRGRRPRGKVAGGAAPQRQSSRLAAKGDGKYVAMADKAAQRTALKNSLASCSTALQNQVCKRNILNHTSFPISATDLRKLVGAAGLSSGNAPAGGQVLPQLEC